MTTRGLLVPSMTPTRLIKIADVRRLTALSTSGIYERMQQGGFPRPLKTGARGVAWREDEVLGWIASRPRGGSDRPAA